MPSSISPPLPGILLKKKRPVQVVHCPNIPAPVRGGGNAKRPSSSTRDGDSKNGKDAEREEFQKMWKSVMDLGTSQLKGYEKKQYDARKIVEMGGKAPVAQKVPYRILMGKRAKQKKREVNREQEIKESGLVVARKRSAASALVGENNNSKKPRRSDSSPFPVVGKMRGGTLFLNRQTIQASQRGGRGGRRR